MRRLAARLRRWRGQWLRQWLRQWRRRRRPAASLLAELAAGPGGLAAMLFEQPGAGLVAVDRAGGLVRSNAALRALAGPTADLAIGASAAALFDPAGRPAVTAEIAWCLRGQPPRPAFAAVLRGGIAVGVSAQPLREAARPTGRVAIGGVLLRLTDASAQRELERQLAQAQKMQAVGQLAGGIAHDFNNLLTAVTGAAESAATQPGLPAEVLDDLAQIRASAVRGAALVRQLLAFGRQQTLQPQVLAVNDVVAELSSLLRRVLGTQIRLDLELAEPGGRVRADPTQFDQVLVNLAVNARDAMPDGGTLTVRTGHRTLLRAQANGAEWVPPGRYVMVEVADTGVGIPPNILPRIFDPFFTTRREQGGSGLGLSTVHGIVRQSEGFLEADSTGGEGARFRIFLPRADDGATSIPAPPAAVRVARPALLVIDGGRPALGTVLLVDDEEPVLRLAERALTRAGWDVLAAESGPLALAALAVHQAAGGELVGLVTDMAMHGMDGVQVLRAVRARTRSSLPGLLMSGYAEAGLRAALAGEGQVAFLAKPYTLGELTDSLRAAIDGGGQEIPETEQTELSVAKSQLTNI